MRLRWTLVAVGMFVVIAAVAAVVLRPGPGPAAASAEPGGGEVAGLAVGSINGTVTEEGTGTPLEGICVDVVDSEFAFFGFETTDAAGAYSVAGLASGDYRVEFSDCSLSPTYATEWYNDRPDFDSADLVAVVAGSKTSGIDAALAIGGSINGTVTEEGTGTPIAHICVDVADFSVAGFGFVMTDESGAYSIGGLASGNYEVMFSACTASGNHFAEYYNDQPDAATADLVAVTIGAKTSGIDAELAVGGSINGTVTDEATGLPLADICVDAIIETAVTHSGLIMTDASGAYSIGGLESGDYKIEFFDCGETVTYLGEFYDDREDFDSDLVTVVAGAKTAGINAALAIGGSINGTVTDEATGMPLADICVDVFDPFAFSGLEVTDAAGAYSVGGLAGGAYTVEFFDCGDTGNYRSEFYDDQPDFGSATLVAVVAGAKTSGIDAQLSEAAAVLIGDANCSGSVDSIDATVILQFAAGLLGGLPCADAADTNGDGDITSVDATLILQFTAGLLDVLGAVG